MKILKTSAELKTYRTTFSKEIIAFVPTMGALHEGHLALVQEAKKHADVVICSIFVNPLQFNNPEDFENYPKTLQQDIQLLNENNCHALFIPDAEEIYPKEPQLSVQVGIHETWMEGAHRPGHFSGVVIILTKLFNLVRPHLTFFGQKDFQQCMVVKHLIEDFGFDITLHIVPTVREKNGLAKSSRNKRLDSHQIERATSIYRYLRLFEKEIKVNPAGFIHAKEKIFKIMQEEDFITPEYLEVADAETGQPVFVLQPSKSYALCTAAFVDKIRLIDNIIIYT